MNKALAALCVFLIILSGFLWVKMTTLENQVKELQKPSLYETMTLMQSVVHKISYAIDNENGELLDFYIHELEEATEEIIEANLVYHDQPVGQLTEKMLEPTIEVLEDAVESGDWDRVQERNQVMIRACNNCHTSTGYSWRVKNQLRK
ncbi:hypothetical protein [Rhodohalobacter sp.]|uniref:hypothetical protein n=1 Tax=Rhodohalobacter sp. TaxID=1974210 RepID=UPI002ACD7DA2|nr:hypothetical protein [Rhodohalobacter sp.]MDZ7758060.1 hypothetical protein [Rhodohalobacter sp.]